MRTVVDWQRHPPRSRLLNLMRNERLKALVIGLIAIHGLLNFDKCIIRIRGVHYVQNPCNQRSPS